LAELPPAPRGVPQIEVTFDIDANGILDVTAKDKATGKSQSIKITGSTGLNKDEIEKMKGDAEKHAESDQQEKERIEARNKADSLVYTAEKSLKDAGDKAPKDIKEDVEKKIKDVKDSLEKGSKEEIETKTKDLSDALQKIGEIAYRQQAEKEKSEKSDASDKSDKSEKSKKNEKDVEEGEVVE